MLKNGPEAVFQLEIAGYEFPEAQTGYDSNWLMIRMTAAMPQGTWTVTDPSLLTYEVEELAAWLDAVAANRETGTALRFTEPNLSFRTIAREDGTRALRVSFAAECRPPWARPASSGARDAYIEFPKELLDLPAAAASLRAQLAQYPPRAAL